MPSTRAFSDAVKEAEKANRALLWSMLPRELRGSGRDWAENKVRMAAREMWYRYAEQYQISIAAADALFAAAEQAAGVSVDMSESITRASALPLTVQQQLDEALARVHQLESELMVAHREDRAANARRYVEWRVARWELCCGLLGVLFGVCVLAAGGPWALAFVLGVRYAPGALERWGSVLRPFAVCAGEYLRRCLRE